MSPEDKHLQDNTTKIMAELSTMIQQYDSTLLAACLMNRAGALWRGLIAVNKETVKSVTEIYAMECVHATEILEKAPILVTMHGSDKGTLQ